MWSRPSSAPWFRGGRVTSWRSPVAVNPDPMDAIPDPPWRAPYREVPRSGWRDSCDLHSQDIAYRTEREIEGLQKKLQETGELAEHHRRISHMLWEHNKSLESMVYAYETEQQLAVQILQQRLSAVEKLCSAHLEVLAANDHRLPKAASHRPAPNPIVSSLKVMEERLCTLELALTHPKGQIALARRGNSCKKRRPVEEKAKRSAGASRSEPRRIDWSKVDPKKWTFPAVKFSGGYTYGSSCLPVIENVCGPIEEGRKKLKDHPDLYDGLFWQTNMVNWPPENQSYCMVRRTGSGFAVQELATGSFTWQQAKYEVLPVLKLDDIQRDAHSAKMSFWDMKLPVLLPGRGYGCADVPNLKIIGDVDPSDVKQGKVGDCWLLSAISALAEFDGAILKLFSKTPDIKNMPKDAANEYIVTLYDLSCWEPVDIVMDESLCAYPVGASEVLGCLPSVDGELWVCYLEKAVAIHCGGWDEINGGACTHAWSLLTGCRYVYEFRKGDDDLFTCYGKLDPNTMQWDYGSRPNSPHSGNLWPTTWPSVGGGGPMDKKVSTEDFFDRMCQWEDSNFLMACGSDGTDDSQSINGVICGHAYTILECLNDVAGTDIDLIKLRNPWGRFELKDGMWTDDGPGWKRYPQIQAKCKPVKADDGIFWMERGEFFKYFSVVYLCAKDMSEFLK